MEQKDRLIMSRKELKRKGILELVQAGQLSLQEASERMGLITRSTTGNPSVWG